MCLIDFKGIAIGKLISAILASFMAMGLDSIDAMRSIGTTRYGNLGGRYNEADATFGPSTWARDNWPSFVVEVGVSQNLKQL